MSTINENYLIAAAVLVAIIIAVLLALLFIKILNSDSIAQTVTTNINVPPLPAPPVIPGVAVTPGVVTPGVVTPDVNPDKCAPYLFLNRCNEDGLKLYGNAIKTTDYLCKSSSTFTSCSTGCNNDATIKCDKTCTATADDALKNICKSHCNGSLDISCTTACNLMPKPELLKICNADCIANSSENKCNDDCQTRDTEDQVDNCYEQCTQATGPFRNIPPCKTCCEAVCSKISCNPKPSTLQRIYSWIKS